jgi:hypothetical protein
MPVRWQSAFGVDTPQPALEESGIMTNAGIKEQYDRKFWEATNAGYAALRANPAAWAEVQAERKVWDATLKDGLDPTERWAEDGDIKPPGQQENPS